jgi:hypothetical protein
LLRRALSSDPASSISANVSRPLALTNCGEPVDQ